MNFKIFVSILILNFLVIYEIQTIPILLVEESQHQNFAEELIVLVDHQNNITLYKDPANSACFIKFTSIETPNKEELFIISFDYDDANMDKPNFPYPTKLSHLDSNLYAEFCEHFPIFDIIDDENRDSFPSFYNDQHQVKQQKSRTKRNTFVGGRSVVMPDTGQEMILMTKAEYEALIGARNGSQNKQNNMNGFRKSNKFQPPQIRPAQISHNSINNNNNGYLMDQGYPAEETGATSPSTGTIDGHQAQIPDTILSSGSLHLDSSSDWPAVNAMNDYEMNQQSRKVDSTSSYSSASSSSSQQQQQQHQQQQWSQQQKAAAGATATRNYDQQQPKISSVIAANNYQRSQSIVTNAGAVRPQVHYNNNNRFIMQQNGVQLNNDKNHGHSGFIQQNNLIGSSSYKSVDSSSRRGGGLAFASSPQIEIVQSNGVVNGDGAAYGNVIQSNGVSSTGTGTGDQALARTFNNNNRNGNNGQDNYGVSETDNLVLGESNGARISAQVNGAQRSRADNTNSRGYLHSEETSVLRPNTDGSSNGHVFDNQGGALVETESEEGPERVSDGQAPYSRRYSDFALQGQGQEFREQQPLSANGRANVNGNGNGNGQSYQQPTQTSSVLISGPTTYTPSGVQEQQQPNTNPAGAATATGAAAGNTNNDKSKCCIITFTCTILYNPSQGQRMKMCSPKKQQQQQGSSDSTTGGSTSRVNGSNGNRSSQPNKIICCKC